MEIGNLLEAKRDDILLAADKHGAHNVRGLWICGTCSAERLIRVLSKVWRSPSKTLPLQSNLFIVSTAKYLKLPIITKDKILQKLTSVKTIW